MKIWYRGHTLACALILATGLFADLKMRTPQMMRPKKMPSAELTLVVDHAIEGSDGSPLLISIKDGDNKDRLAYVARSPMEKSIRVTGLTATIEIHDNNAGLLVRQQVDSSLYRRARQISISSTDHKLLVTWEKSAWTKVFDHKSRTHRRKKIKEVVVQTVVHRPTKGSIKEKKAVVTKKEK